MGTYKLAGASVVSDTVFHALSLGYRHIGESSAHFFMKMFFFLTVPTSPVVFGFVFVL